MKAIIFIAFIAVYLITESLAGSQYQDDQIHWWDTDNNNEYKSSSTMHIPFPQCLLSNSGSKMFDSYTFQKLFDKKLLEEEESLKRESYSSYDNDNEKYGTMNGDSYELRTGSTESRTAARAAIKVTRDIMTILMCDLNGTDSSNLNNILSKFHIPENYCSYLDKPDCSEKQAYRTITGVCNNLINPYQGSAQTAFGRLTTAAYEDSLSQPRRKSIKGGLLPSCRYLSLAMGSRPIFNRNYNNFFVIFGQLIAHDIALSVPVSNTYSQPISSCSCSDKYDWNKCNVIPIAPDDPYLRGQKCMAFPATSQAFKNQICSLGVKEHMNGNTALIDLSLLYGSSLKVAESLRGKNGLLKTTRVQWSKYDIPPGQREGKSCTDSTYKRKCLAGGDSRLIINLLFTGIHAIFLRLHNQIAVFFHEKNPAWTSNQIYEETRIITIAFFQRMTYIYYLPILLGEETFKKEFNPLTPTRYDENVAPIIYTEFSTVAFRLHSLVRDLFTRCTYDGKRIDEIWLHDIMHKVKYAYDVENQGLDSILCGSFYDYGFSYDGNFAHQIHNRLFESSNDYNKLWRNDLIAINICRAREHGIPDYNTLREFCSLPKAETFDDLGDTINYDGIKKLKRLYRSVHDIDPFVALNLEDPIHGSLIGRVSECIIVKQFKALQNGDRFHYRHPGVLTPAQLAFVENFPIYCLFCQTIHLKEIPMNPFKPPSDNNPLATCSECDSFKMEPPSSGKI